MPPVLAFTALAEKIPGHLGRPDGKTKFFRAGKTGCWRKALSEQQAAQLIVAHRETLIEFGYLAKAGKPAP